MAITSNCNYFSGLVKILENPRHQKLKKTEEGKISVCRAQLPQTRGSDSILNLVFWGKLGHDFKKYYQINDYIIIEGYISARLNELTDSSIQLPKAIQFELTVLRLYPFLLSSRKSITKN